MWKPGSKKQLGPKWQKWAWGSENCSHVSAFQQASGRTKNVEAPQSTAHSTSCNLTVLDALWSSWRVLHFLCLCLKLSGGLSWRSHGPVFALDSLRNIMFKTNKSLIKKSLLQCCSSTNPPLFFKSQFSPSKLKLSTCVMSHMSWQQLPNTESLWVVLRLWRANCMTWSRKFCIMMAWPLLGNIHLEHLGAWLYSYKVFPFQFGLVNAFHQDQYNVVSQTGFCSFSSSTTAMRWWSCLSIFEWWCMHAIVENIGKQCPTGFEQGKYHLLVSNLKTCQAGKPWGLVFQRPQFGGPGPRNGCSAKGPQSTSSLFDLITLCI